MTEVVQSISYFDHEDNNDWTKSSVSLVEAWLRKCMSRSHAHSQASTKTRRRHHLIAVPELVCARLASAMAFWAIGDDTGRTLPPRITVVCLACGSSILNAAQRMFNFGEVHQRHAAASSSYLKLAHRIEVSVFTPNHLRGNVQALLAELSVEFSNLIATSPHVSVTE